MTADHAIRWLTAAAVLAVGSFAAVVSYSHICDLAAGLVMLHAAGRHAVLAAVSHLGCLRDSLFV